MKKISTVPEHHVYQGFCTNRPKYRDGNQPKAVKVYTINLESKYLIVSNVPDIHVEKELTALFASFGPILETKILHDYPKIEKFTTVLLFKFKKINDARKAKRKMDNLSFMGNVLHVYYSPEFETVDETREKLNQRRMEVSGLLKLYEKQKGKFYKTKVPEQNCQRRLNCSSFDDANVKKTNFVPLIANLIQDFPKPEQTRPSCSTAMAIEQGQWHKTVDLCRKNDEKVIEENKLNVETLLINANRGSTVASTKHSVDHYATPSLSSSNVIVKHYDHPRKRLKLIPRNLKTS